MTPAPSCPDGDLEVDAPSTPWCEKHPFFAGLLPSAIARREMPVDTAWEAIGWWESRRFAFNIIVGCAGLLSCIVAVVVAIAAAVLFNSDYGLPDPPAFGVIAIAIYAIMANVCYTGGWIAELIVRKAWPLEADKFATRSFSLGLTFSILLSLTPGLVIGAGGILGLVGHLIRAAHLSR